MALWDCVNVILILGMDITKDSDGVKKAETRGVSLDSASLAQLAEDYDNGLVEICMERAMETGRKQELSLFGTTATTEISFFSHPVYGKMIGLKQEEKQVRVPFRQFFGMFSVVMDDSWGECV